MNTGKSLLLAFVIGSSLISSAITFMYTGKAFHNANHTMNDGLPPLDYEIIPLLVLGLFGIFNVINVFLRSKTNQKTLVTIVIGGLAGLTFSLIGRFKYGLPKRIFGYTSQNENNVHYIAFTMYAFIFTMIVQSVNNYFIR